MRIYHVLVIIAIMILPAARVWSQIENIQLGEEVNMDKFYLGLLAKSLVSQKELTQSGYLTFQGGGRINLMVIPEKIRIRSFGVLRVVGGEASQRFTNFETIFTPHRKLHIHIGVMATPTTELRPNPVTWQSQVETNAERTIPGGRPGVKLKYSINPDLSLGYGLHNQEQTPTHHVKVVYRGMAFSSYVRESTLFLASKWKQENSQVVMTHHDCTLALSAIISVFRKYRIYGDVAVDYEENEQVFSEWGIRRHFEKEGPLRGFFMMSYNHTFQNYQGGFFIHI